MKIGDAVKVTDTFPFPPYNSTGRTGIIIDEIELNDGFSEYEVLMEDGDVMWYNDLMLKVISESR